MEGSKWLERSIKNGSARAAYAVLVISPSSFSDHYSSRMFGRIRPSGNPQSPGYFAAVFLFIGLFWFGLRWVLDLKKFVYSVDRQS